jgi:luciferase family oxidoreductase group 1
VSRVPLSVLDLVPVRAGSTAGESLRESVVLATAAEELGYARYWFAEHHSMPSIGSSAPEVLIAHVAAATRTIRVGSGGVMLPNHAPLRVAEAFHTLEALHPGRIDLGLGRAPGTDPAASRALRPFDADSFPDQVRELLALSRRAFPVDHPFASVRVIPEDVTLPPIWILASSGATAAFAGTLGLGYGFARHFSPARPGPPIRAYRDGFVPSARVAAPHVILGVAVVCAETDKEADYLATSSDLAWVRRHRGDWGRLPSPDEASRFPYTAQDRVVVDTYRQRVVVGTPQRVVEALQVEVDDTGASELMVTSMIHGARARMRSYELLAHAWYDQGGEPASFLTMPTLC